MSVSKAESERLIGLAIQSGVEHCKTPHTARAALVQAGLINEDGSATTPYKYTPNVEEAAKVGNAQFAFFQKYGKLPLYLEDLVEFFDETKEKIE